jgi:O-methyltransferase involved in polyketide biosynthesis
VVLGTLAAAGLPGVVVLAGGYAADAERTAELHTRVFEEARRMGR